ncbi:uncharacterized protein LOC110820401 [Carica papaya]|uniref:uncharacterized protein LOC110820401 n=1 Tax=Carica papaya TaxID=3649 RepID=UPI000B8CC1DA|nr:uncharacterized protein LOC110820401 [Carica papaya]
MAQNSEKRFNQIMDKLFKAPKSTPGSSSSSSGVELSRGKKRPSTSSVLALVEPKTRLEISDGLRYSSALADPSQAPLCRPWDRGDLMRRLATFKSMTWFAKPKVVSAVNCARRGWVNVDMDIIACEACGARLLFSTPPSWTQQQVEKAALVFSLKLDNGHKLLCPWIDNACDEMLVEFPPTTPLELVDRSKERSSALLQLLALPVISSSAIEYMKCPELEEFLRDSMTLEYGNLSADISQSESLGDEDGESSAKLYYQAQKLINLCGWEPRLLPYVVDCKDKSNPLLNDADTLNSLAVHLGQYPSSSAHNADTINVLEANKNTKTCDTVESDPKSVVLDCKLCGASVGLWTFRTAPLPLELFRVVGFTEINENNGRAHDSGNEKHGDYRGSIENFALHAKEQLPNLKLTIAGGPPATKQNFKAMISLPVVGRSLRARFSHDAEFGDHICTNQDHSHSKNMISGEIALSENMGLLENEKDNQGHNNSVGNQQSSYQEHGATEKDDNLRVIDSSFTSLGEANLTSQRTFENDRHDSQMENPMDIRQNVERDSCQDDMLPENAENVGLVGSVVKDNCNSQAGDASNTFQDVNMTNINTGQDNLSEVIISDNSSRQEIGEVNMLCSKEISSGKTHSRVLESVRAPDNGQEVIIERVQTPGNGKVKDSSAGDYLKQLPSDKAMEFDPIRQHRHFCPWISSTGSRVPGWRQTLLALLHKKESATSSPSSPSLVKVDDPITSVRRLFMSPSAKKLKPSQGSS